ncbi:MAG: hypothetical protein LBJ38_01080 [Oscillospiraceae bacterium]|nr:hypothetical protein [Oscillospiraceae bacterium]
MYIYMYIYELPLRGAVMFTAPLLAVASAKYEMVKLQKMQKMRRWFLW